MLSISQQLVKPLRFVVKFPTMILVRASRGSSFVFETPHEADLLLDDECSITADEAKTGGRGVEDCVDCLGWDIIVYTDDFADVRDSQEGFIVESTGNVG